MRNLFSNFLFESALTLATFMFFDSFANFSIVEFIIRQGPHHSAQKSIKTNCSFFKTESIFFSLRGMIFRSEFFRNSFLYITLNGNVMPAKRVDNRKRIIAKI